ncbi:MAG: hypothetical protein M1828_001277 [Chrysothrix sp. TS-e1954]|nr:MAG: hypothetical protein M1828_001277 [Chrysothrix sp. TS-e1954]
MTTLVPRPPYTQDELAKLYPAQLELKHVQIILRHGERTPVKARFQNAGLHPHWPYCSIARRMLTTALTSDSSTSSPYSTSPPALDRKTARWDALPFRRKFETFGPNDLPVLASGPPDSASAHDSSSICLPGELTDLGRVTTLRLGQRLRHLYVEQLGFLPDRLPEKGADGLLYIRSTPIPRALESTQQALTGLYPPGTWSAQAASTGLDIVARDYSEENLVPNDPTCRRFRELGQIFAQRAADKYNTSPEMAFLTKKLGKYLQPPSDGRVKVDGKPRLSGIMDTTNAALAHRHLGSGTSLPGEFYEEKVRATMDKIVTEEWFAGYRVSREYRIVGIGGLMADLTRRALAAAAAASSSSSSLQQTTTETRGEEERGRSPQKLCLAGAHDTTIGAVLASLGCFPEGSKWPRFTAHVALETFVARSSAETTTFTPTASASASASPSPSSPLPPPQTQPQPQPQKSSWSSYLPSLPSFLPSLLSPFPQTAPPPPDPLDHPTPQNTYIRLRYNDHPLTLPGCRSPGAHLDGDQTFCTLDAFRRVVGGFAPPREREKGGWRGVCGENLGRGVVDEDEDEG